MGGSSSNDSVGGGSSAGSSQSTSSNSSANSDKAESFSNAMSNAERPDRAPATSTDKSDTKDTNDRPESPNDDGGGRSMSNVERPDRAPATSSSDKPETEDKNDRPQSPNDNDNGPSMSNAERPDRAPAVSPSKPDPTTETTDKPESLSGDGGNEPERAAGPPSLSSEERANLEARKEALETSMSSTISVPELQSKVAELDSIERELNAPNSQPGLGLDDILGGMTGPSNVPTGPGDIPADNAMRPDPTKDIPGYDEIPAVLHETKSYTDGYVDSIIGGASYGIETKYGEGGNTEIVTTPQGAANIKAGPVSIGVNENDDSSITGQIPQTPAQVSFGSNGDMSIGVDGDLDLGRFSIGGKVGYTDPEDDEKAGTLDMEVRGHIDLPGLDVGGRMGVSRPIGGDEAEKSESSNSRSAD